MKHLVSTLILFVAVHTCVKAQNIGINDTGASPDASAILDVTSTDKGMLIPRMTELQRTAISSPATGLLVYQTDNTDGFWYYDGTTWSHLSPSGSSGEFESIGGVVRNTTSTGSDDFVFGSPQLDDDGDGDHDRRIFFDKSRGAFRAGGVTGDEWDEFNIGYSSTALGQNSIASGTVSFAAGGESIASGIASVAMGAYTNAQGDFSTAMGRLTSAPSYAETTIGTYSKTYTPNSTIFFDAADRLFTIGNGVSDVARSNAMVVLKNGNIGIGKDVPTSKLNVAGNVDIEDNGGILSLIGSDHSFIHWYPDGLAAGRKGYTGWGSAGNDNFQVVNEIAGAHIVLNTSGGGNVGIETSSPTQARLVVNGGVSNSLGSYSFLNSVANVNTSTGSGTYSIYATDRIATSEVNVFSDQRIKNIKGLSNSANDLATLTKIEVTDYSLKDTIANGNTSFKKVIAQQLKEVYPQAVSNTLSSVIPDIYQLSQMENGWVSLATDLVIGDKVRLIFEDSDELVTVEETSSKGFRVNLEHAGEVFVYGKEIADFHTVDYEAIAMLNVSATQELARRIITLENEKAASAEIMLSLKKKLNALEEKIDAIENPQGTLNSTVFNEGKKEGSQVEIEKEL